ncbi:tRNA-uridine aminocarboxypropyltransferase [Undibacterium sp. Ji22W]|uniref:tRNA-uridine aminocarboxypropyltransferase n=1 Tax=Undibacterium sp. Ji22W TaxID=3413038 RepID=UPI003BF00276
MAVIQQQTSEQNAPSNVPENVRPGAHPGARPSGQAKRPICPQCERALRACICACVRRVDCQTEVLILQHPAEVHHVKGSARLLHLCLPKSAIVVGEAFDANALQQHLNANGKTSVLLYPDSVVFGSTLVAKTGSVASVPAASSHQPGSDAAIRLVLIDASWRHSKQMLLQSPLLRALPRYALTEVPASRYQIRQAHAEDQLSTFEACTYALMQVESHNQQIGNLLQAFDAFNALQIQFGVNNLLRVKK